MTLVPPPGLRSDSRATPAALSRDAKYALNKRLMEFASPRLAGGPLYPCGDSVGATRTPPGMIRDIVRLGDPRLLASNEAVDPASDGPARRSSRTCSRRATRLPASASPLRRSESTGGSRSSTSRSERIPAPCIVLVNPEIVESSGEQKEEEGCLSIPDFAEKVVRPARVRARFFDAIGRIARDRGRRASSRARSVPRDRPPERHPLRGPAARVEARADLAQDREIAGAGGVVREALQHARARGSSSCRRSSRGTCGSTPAGRRSTTSSTSGTCARSSSRTCCAGTCSRAGSA